MEKERENGEGKTIPALGQPAMHHLSQNKLFNAKKLHKTTEKCCLEVKIRTYLIERVILSYSISLWSRWWNTKHLLIFGEVYLFFNKTPKSFFLGAGKLRGVVKTTRNIYITYMYDAGYI